MSEIDVTVQETEVDDATEGDESPKDGETTDAGNGLPDDAEVLKKEVARLRKENAKVRVGKREEAEAAKKWKEHVESQKTETQRLADRTAELEAELKKSNLEKLQAKLAREHGIPDDLIEFVVGDDEDEMTEKAKRLAASVAKTKPKGSANAFRAGDRGGPVATKGEDAWLRDLLIKG